MEENENNKLLDLTMANMSLQMKNTCDRFESGF